MSTFSTDCRSAASRLTRFFARRLDLADLAETVQHLDVCDGCSAAYARIGRELGAIDQDWREHLSMEHVEQLVSGEAGQRAMSIADRLTSAMTHLAAGDLAVEIPTCDEAEGTSPELAGLSAAMSALVRNLSIMNAQLGPVGQFRSAAPQLFAQVAFRGGSAAPLEVSTRDLLLDTVIPRMHALVGVVRTAVVLCSALAKVGVSPADLDPSMYARLIRQVTADPRFVGAVGEAAALNLEAEWLALARSS